MEISHVLLYKAWKIYLVCVESPIVSHQVCKKISQKCSPLDFFYTLKDKDVAFRPYVPQLIQSHTVPYTKFHASSSCSFKLSYSYPHRQIDELPVGSRSAILAYEPNFTPLARCV